MFIETHKDDNITLTFIKSANVQAFPCGRRYSKADLDGNPDTPNDVRYIPFDPEARLNTEANNRKHSSLNGYTQIYLKEWDKSNKRLTMSLAGYLFTITLPTFSLIGEQESASLDACVPNNFGIGIINALRTKIDRLITDTTDEEARAELTSELTALDGANKIYANIRVEDVQLYSGHQDYYTGILRNQTDSGIPETSLDLLNTETANATDDNRLEEMRNFENYYFSGLSFSTIPLTGIIGTRSSIPHSFERDPQDAKLVNQQLASLCILEKVKTSDTPEVWEWQIHKPAYLPKIAHGTTEDSVVLGDTLIERRLDDEDNVITEGNITVDNNVITKNLDASGVITAIEELENNANNIVARNANVTNLLTAATADLEIANINALNVTGGEATIENIRTSNIQHLVDGQYRAVPVIFLKNEGDEYQLQITHVNDPDKVN